MTFGITRLTRTDVTPQRAARLYLYFLVAPTTIQAVSLRSGSLASTAAATITAQPGGQKLYFIGPLLTAAGQYLYAGDRLSSCGQFSSILTSCASWARKSTAVVLDFSFDNAGTRTNAA